ncbi:MAG: hypothetical protein PHU06_12685 [Gallionella sp.]|nr:hypothetical protein [Gallionella sp.]MDD4959480.1 hypothetical protein [Gallionella sp.]
MSQDPYEGLCMSGIAMTSALEGMGGFKAKALAILKENGVEDFQSDKAYPFFMWANTLHAIAKEVGSFTIYNVGRKIPETAIWPSEINDIHAAEASINVAYKMNISGENPKADVGGYQHVKLSENSCRVICDNPLPCDLDQGIIEGIAEKFATPGQILKVVHEEGSCRKNQGRSCSYLVSWYDL